MVWEKGGGGREANKVDKSTNSTNSMCVGEDKNPDLNIKKSNQNAFPHLSVNKIMTSKRQHLCVKCFHIQTEIHNKDMNSENLR